MYNGFFIERIGEMTIYSGTVVSGALELSSGDSGLDMLVNYNGKLILSSGGIASDIVNEGLVVVQSGGVVENVEVTNNNLPSYSGCINIYSGGSGRNITIHSGNTINGFRVLEETNFDNIENVKSIVLFKTMHLNIYHLFMNVNML